MKKTENTSDTVLIGRVGSPVGIKGEVRITLYAQDSANLKEGKVLLLKRAANANDPKAKAAHDISAAVRRVRYQKDRPVVKLDGVDDRNTAEEIRGMEVSIYADDLEELPEGEHYVRDLIGCRVVDAARNGEEVGLLREVIQNTAQSILEVETPEGSVTLRRWTERDDRPMQAFSAVITGTDTPVRGLSSDTAGETLTGAGRGWHLMTWQGLPLGFAKGADGQWKNHVPKGIRIPIRQYEAREVFA